MIIAVLFSVLVGGTAAALVVIGVARMVNGGPL